VIAVNVTLIKAKQRNKQGLYMPADIKKAVEIARELKKRERFNKIEFYDPYPYQQEFHSTGASAN